VLIKHSRCQANPIDKVVIYEHVKYKDKSNTAIIATQVLQS